MSVTDPWKPFQEVLQAPWDLARAWKDRTGRKVIGHLLPDVPEEIIHAAGALPMAVEGAGVQVSGAQAHIPGYSCSHAMGAIEMAMKGELRVLDGMVIPYVCDTTRNLFHIWQRCFPHIANDFLRLPKRIDHPGAQDYLREEFRRLFESVGRMTGLEAHADRLAASLELYDRSRAELRRAYRLHQERPEVWTAARVQMVYASAVRAPREEHLEWMEGLPWEEESSESQDRIPIYVRGKVWDPPVILDLLDTLKMVVAADEIVTGYRSVAVPSEMAGDPINVLVARHMSKIPYTGYHQEPARMVQGFVDRVRESRA
ncbi:MAG: 2-hydroxyacyl-CoA dehydratase, partial [Deltaproteobacteria bacterium]|nr:2-hydroxyacyl-CoA dehydratase [Deltaproteobacteria bacterium]